MKKKKPQKLRSKSATRRIKARKEQTQRKKQGRLQSQKAARRRRKVNPLTRLAREIGVPTSKLVAYLKARPDVKSNDRSIVINAETVLLVRECQQEIRAFRTRKKDQKEEPKAKEAQSKAKPAKRKPSKPEASESKVSKTELSKTLLAKFKKQKKRKKKQDSKVKIISTPMGGQPGYKRR